MQSKLFLLKKGLKQQKIAKASQKREKIAEEMLDKKCLIALFSRPGMNENMRKTFIEIAQIQELSEMEKETVSQEINVGVGTTAGHTTTESLTVEGAIDESQDNVSSIRGKEVNAAERLR